MYWGQFGKVKVAGGGFDGPSLKTGSNALLTAARVMVDFWDAEDGYYLNGTYYGAKNLLAIGGAIQAQDGAGEDPLKKAMTLDFLLERKAGEGGAFTIESEYANYDELGGYYSEYKKSDGGYILGAYLIGKPAGPGKFQLLGKYAQANFSEGITPDFDQKTTEFNLNYIIKDFNARVMFFFKNTDFSAVKRDSKQVGVGLQIQM